MKYNLWIYVERWLLCLFMFYQLHMTAGDTCAYVSGGTTRYMYCEHGCCGTSSDRSCCSYEISTSVLVVACAVSGLVLLALISAIIICCYKNYRDKQNSRVRNLRHENRREPQRNPTEPPKPPTYIEAPPAYSVEMPDSHFRPVTANGQYVPYNQRFSNSSRQQSTTAARHQTSTVASTAVPPSAYRIPVSDSTPSNRTPARDNRAAPATASLPGLLELPPSYSSLGQEPQTTQTHRRFNRTSEEQVLPVYSSTTPAAGSGETATQSGLATNTQSRVQSSRLSNISSVNSESEPSISSSRMSSTLSPEPDTGRTSAARQTNSLTSVARRTIPGSIAEADDASLEHEQIT